MVIASYLFHHAENTKEESDSGLEDEGDDKVQNSGSLQRQRTAWTTSIGHDRVSPEELDKRYYM